jgi:hypothetical protein
LLAVASSNNLASSTDKAIHLGIMGDSASDEYRADENRGGAYAATTLNWVELLQRYRGIDIGPWGTWGGARRTGYKYNWALSGAVAQEIISVGQAAGLARQVAAGEVNTVVLYVGANNFDIWNGTYASIYYGGLSGAVLQSYIDTIVSSITQAIDTVQAAGPVNFIVASIVDRGPTARFIKRFPDARKRQIVTNSIKAVNAGIQAAANARSRVVYVDLNSLAAYYLSHMDQNGSVIVSGQAISLTVPGDEPHHGLLSDNEHGGTVFQGVLANFLFIKTVDHHFGQNIPPFSEKELVVNAGITH